MLDMLSVQSVWDMYVPVCVCVQSVWDMYVPVCVCVQSVWDMYVPVCVWDMYPSNALCVSLKLPGQDGVQVLP